MANVKVYKEAAMPSLWVANAVYWVKVGAKVLCYVTDSVGTPYAVGTPTTTDEYSGQARYSGGGGGAHTITHHDIRNINTVPSDYTVDGVGGTWWDFKDRAVVGLPGANVYASVMTVVQWNPTGSGGGVHQVGFNDNTGLYYRYGAANSGAWDVWQKIITLKNRQAHIAQQIDNNESIEAILGYTDGLGNYEKVKLIATRIDNAARQHFAIAVNTAYSTASASIGDSRFFVDGTTGNVGIATTNPIYGFDVVTSARTASGLRASGSLYQFLANGWATAVKLESGGAVVYNDKFGMGESGGYFYFSTSNIGNAGGSAIYSWVVAPNGEVIIGGATNNTTPSGNDVTIRGSMLAYQGVNIGSNTCFLAQGTGNALRIVTPSGWADVGAQNNGFFHFQTDRPAFYFNKDTSIDGYLRLYGTSTSLQPGVLILNAGSYLTGNNSNWQFLTSGGTAVPIKTGGVVASDSYADTAPANGLFVKGGVQLKALSSGGVNMVVADFQGNLGIQSIPASGEQWQNDAYDYLSANSPTYGPGKGLYTNGGYRTTTQLLSASTFVWDDVEIVMRIGGPAGDYNLAMPKPSDFPGRIIKIRNATYGAAASIVIQDYPIYFFATDSGAGNYKIERINGDTTTPGFDYYTGVEVQSIECSINGVTDYYWIAIHVDR